METLSTSVSTIKFPSLHHPKSSHHHHHEQSLYHLISHKPHFIPSTTKTKKVLSNYKTTTSIRRPVSVDPPSSASPRASAATAALPLKKPSPPLPPESHQKAATGYAVALLDVARCGNVLEAVAWDVKRLSRWLKDESFLCLDKKNRGEVLLNGILEKGRFQKQLVKLVKLLVGKTNADVLLSQVLEEFERIYNELKRSRTQVVLVPSHETKMSENQVLEIAMRVQKLSGASTVKVRQLIG